MKNLQRMVVGLFGAVATILIGVVATISLISNFVMAPERLHEIQGVLPGYLQLVIRANPLWFLAFLVLVLALVAWAIWPNMEALKETRETAAKFSQLEQKFLTLESGLERHHQTLRDIMVTSDIAYRAEQSNLAAEYHANMQTRMQEYDTNMNSIVSQQLEANKSDVYMNFDNRFQEIDIQLRALQEVVSVLR